MREFVIERLKEVVRSEVTHGLTGTGCSIGGIYVSTQNIEAWLRIASLLIGIAVGVATLISIVRKLRK
jgi:hypothetical protein